MPRRSSKSGGGGPRRSTRNEPRKARGKSRNEAGLFEEPHLYLCLSGREFLDLVGRLRGLPESRLDRKIDAFLELFDLATDGGAPMSSYSEGMRQKVLVTAALMHDPDIIILDEPCRPSGLPRAVSAGLKPCAT